ncbi:MAG: hypothetical protein CSA64_03480 [Arachnia propionica]|nr:MAG: hypothetical protein CSA64_03480 [Arachnia propionica]
MPTKPAISGSDRDRVIKAVAEHTHTLLGLTIGFDEHDWAEPSRLPQWTRSHVAAHLIANAQAMLRAYEGLDRGIEVLLYPSKRTRQLEIELGALAAGLELQVALDESAGLLQHRFTDELVPDQVVLLSPDWVVPAEELPLLRLREIVLHTFDINPAATGLQLEQDLADLLLAQECRRLPDPTTTLIADEGYNYQAAPGAQRRVLRGPSADLLLWLARGSQSNKVTVETTP